ncbi:MAG: acyl carrier protein [Clostridia bacterium BRH_c25]|nr:MAG: acyl carrier protein [Clostridia bacterium BRH_c25]
MKVEERVIRAISKCLDNRAQVRLESKLIAELNVDSFDKLMILGAIEDEFAIAIDEADFNSLETVNDIVGSLRAKFPQIESE